MKRRLNVLLGTIVMLVALAAMAGAQQTELVVRMPASPPAHPNLVADLIAEFERLHPDIKVIHEVGGGNPEPLLVQIAAGLAPDVATIEPNAAQEFFRQGFATDLTPYMERDNFDVSIMPPSTEYMMYDGRWYGVPQAGGAFADRAIYYNRDMFDVAGLPYPTTQWTWEEFDTMATRLTIDRDGDGEADQFGFSFEIIDWPIFLWSGGGEIFNEDRTRFTMVDPAAVNALNFWADLVERGVAKTVPPIGFPSGNVAMRTGAFFQAANFASMNLNYDWSVVEFPNGPAGAVNRRTTHPFIIPAEAKNKDAAWEWLKFWLSDDVQRRLVLEWRWRPVQTAPIARELAAMRLDGPPYTYAPFMGLTGSSKPLPVDIPNWPQIQGVIDEAIRSIWRLEGAPQTIMESIEPQVMQLVAEGMQSLQ